MTITWSSVHGFVLDIPTPWESSQEQISGHFRTVITEPFGMTDNSKKRIRGTGAATPAGRGP
jgi:hypothetical protein